MHSMGAGEDEITHQGNRSQMKPPIHNRVWEIPVFEGTYGFYCLWRCIHQEDGCHHSRCPQQDSTCRYVDLCARNRVVFNPSKFGFERKEVDFTVTDDGVKPTKKMLEALANL